MYKNVNFWSSTRNLKFFPTKYFSLEISLVGKNRLTWSTDATSKILKLTGWPWRAENWRLIRPRELFFSFTFEIQILSEIPKIQIFENFISLHRAPRDLGDPELVTNYWEKLNHQVINFVSIFIFWTWIFLLNWQVCLHGQNFLFFLFVFNLHGFRWAVIEIDEGMIKSLAKLFSRSTNHTQPQPTFNAVFQLTARHRYTTKTAKITAYLTHAKNLAGKIIFEILRNINNILVNASERQTIRRY